MTSTLPAPAEQTTPAPLWALRASILRGTHNAANGGLSDTNPDADVWVVMPGTVQPERGFLTMFRKVSELPEGAHITLITTNGFGPHAEPAQAVGEGRIGWMASGAYLIGSGCAREWRQVFGHDLPIPLHDRSETAAQYHALSN